MKDFEQKSEIIWFRNVFLEGSMELCVDGSAVRTEKKKPVAGLEIRGD